MSRRFLIATATIPLLWTLTAPALAQKASSEKPAESRRTFTSDQPKSGTTTERNVRGTKDQARKGGISKDAKAKARKGGTSTGGAAGLAVSDPGSPADKNGKKPTKK
jgi:hypothetical protein